MKAYQDAIVAGTPEHRLTVAEQAGALIVQFSVFQVYDAAGRQAEEVSFAGDQGSAIFWTSLHQVLSTCLDAQADTTELLSSSRPG